MGFFEHNEDAFGRDKKWNNEETRSPKFEKLGQFMKPSNVNFNELRKNLVGDKLSKTSVSSEAKSYINVETGSKQEIASTTAKKDKLK